MFPLSRNTPHNLIYVAHVAPIDVKLLLYIIIGKSPRKTISQINAFGKWLDLGLGHVRLPFRLRVSVIICRIGASSG